jgi:phospholipid/cholesterol/gamma-HCH transport system substrate-binding protein
MNAVKLRDVVSYAVFGIIIAVVLAYFASFGLRVNPPKDRTTLSMDVPDVNGLFAGANVLLRGAPVGRVTNVRTSVGTASVDFYVDGGHQIPVDSEVRLENLSALGESYLELMPRSANGPKLKDGQRIATLSVVQPPSITELATSVVRVLDQMDPAAIKRIISEANIGLPDPNVVLPNLAHASTVFNNMLNDLHGEGRVLLGNFQALLRDAEWVNPDMTTVTPYVASIGFYIQDFYKALPSLFERGEPEGFTNLKNLVQRVQTLLDERGGDLKVIGEALQPKLHAIAGTLMNVDSSQILDHFLQQVPAEGAITLRVRP